MTFYSYLWIAWILAFCVIEFFALTNGVPGDTLSEQIWKLIGTGSERSGMNWFFRVGLAAGLAWVIPHFFTGWEWFKRKGKK